MKKSLHFDSKETLLGLEHKCILDYAIACNKYYNLFISFICVQASSEIKVHLGGKFALKSENSEKC